MPWTASDAEGHTSKADTPKKQKQWAAVANSALEGGASEASAIKQANAAIARADDEQDPEDKEETTEKGVAAKETAAEEEEEEKKKQNRRYPDMLSRSMTLMGARPKSFDPKSREADVMISTGAKVRRVGWFDDPYDEMLSMQPGHCRLERLNAGAPLLNGHMLMGGLENQLGAVIPGSARIHGTQLWARVKLSRTEMADRLARDLEDGIPINVSTGYRTYRERVDRSGETELRTATDWEPFEVSVAPVPAEAGAGFRAALARLATGVTMAGETAEVRTEVVAENDQGVTVTASEAARSAVKPSVTEAAPAADTARLSEFLSICRVGDLDLGFMERTIKSDPDISVEAFRKAAFEELAKRSKKGGPAGAGQSADSDATEYPRVEILDDGHFRMTSRAEAMIEAMSVRILASTRTPAIRTDEQREWVKMRGITDNVTRSFRVYDGSEPPRIPQAREFMKMGWAEIAATCLGYTGSIRNPAQAMRLIERAEQSTSDYPSIFENVLNKVLLARYQLAMPVYREVSIERPFRDFRPHPQIRAGDFPTLQELTETGEITWGGSADSKESVSVKPYGRIFGISRQMIVNDELGAIDQILASAGDIVLVFENTTFFTMFLANPTLNQDSVAVWSDTHNNYRSPGSPPSVDSISQGRKCLRQMKSLSNNYLNIPPRIILTGPDHETEADQMVTTITPTLTTSVNPFSGRLRSVSVANITDKSWYLMADPALLPCFVYGFLGGATGPRVRTEQPFGRQAVNVSLEHDFGCGAIDYRGTFKNAGLGTVVSGG